MGSTPQYQTDAAAPSQGAELKLQPHGATPPTSSYVTANDVLSVQIWNAGVAVTVTLSLLMLLPDGTLSRNSWQLVPTTNRAKSSFPLALTEGFLLGVSASGAQLGYSNRTWVIARLSSGFGSGTIAKQTLLQGYLGVLGSLSWPNGDITQSSDGAGAIVSVTGTLPAAGADISEVVPTNALWELLAFRYSLTTSATAGSRQSDLLIDDGANAVAEVVPASPQIANLVYTYNYMSGCQNVTVANGILSGPIPQNMRLPAGFRIRTHTTGLQAGDQYTAPQYLVREWLVS